MTVSYIPYGGDLRDYAAGPEHVFFTGTPTPAPVSSGGIGDADLAPAPVMSTATPRIRPEPSHDTNPGTMDRALDKYRRGTADLSWDNMGKMLGNIGGILGGPAVVKTGIQGMLHQAFPETISSPVSTYGGYVGPSALGLAELRSGVPLNEVQRRDKVRAAKSSIIGAAEQGYGSYGDAGASRRGQGANRGYAGGDRAATAAHDRSMQGRGYAKGGKVRSMYSKPSSSYYADGGIAGAIESPTPGRGDQLQVEAEEGSFIFPADVVSAFGQGNTDAGVAFLDKAVAKLLAKAPRQAFASGGKVPINVSGGEYAVPPAAVAAFGNGSHRHGSAKLNAMIEQVRKTTAAIMPKLPAPHQ